MTAHQYAYVAKRLARAVRGHGVRWTAERAMAMWRGKLALHGPVGAIRDVLGPIPAMLWSPSLTNDQGVVPAVRVPNELDRAFEIPFGAPIAHPFSRAAIIAHVFYLEYAEEILTYLRNLTIPADLFVSTDSDAKAAELERIFAAYTNGTVEVRITPNRGRDIAPKLVGFRDVYDRYEIFLHIHSKRSPHGGEALVPWRRYLYDHLIGSPEIVDSNLALLGTDNVGVVFPQHMFAVRGVLNWGYDFPFARDLLARTNFRLTKDHLLEFPSGSMFWARSGALRKLLDVGLSFDDFEEEAGKVDGTLAHAIERSYLFFCERAGFRWAKVSRRDSYPLPSTLEQIEDVDDIRIGLRSVFRTVLCPPVTSYSPIERTLPVARRLPVTPSVVDRARINLLIPTINPHQTFGGVATALKVFDRLRDRLGNHFDARIIVTDAPLEPEALKVYEDWSIQAGELGFDHEALLVEDLSSRRGHLSLRRGDVFIASAWWNARHAFDCGAMQLAYFDRKMPFVYLVQDFEPNFSAWSTQWAAAESTYRDIDDDTLAIINSNELYTFMTQRYEFRAPWILPYVPNETVRSAIRSVPREKIILIYGRPSVQRNCFELIVNGLHRWQTRHPEQASQWRIISLGESFPASFAEPVQHFEVLGKIDLEEYGALLSRASIGISLMVSPHPSYPPLEMAMAGLLTITNTFENKDLTLYSDRVENLDVMSEHDLADKIEKAVSRQSEVVVGPGCLKPQSPAGPLVDYDSIAARLRASYYGETCQLGAVIEGVRTVAVVDAPDLRARAA